MTLDDVKKSLDKIDQFRDRNASIVVPIHELPDAIERRNSTENEVRNLFRSFRDQVCVDNGLEHNTPFGKMPNDVAISLAAENKWHALMGYIDYRQHQ